MKQFLTEYGNLLYLLAGVSALLFILSIALIPKLLIRIPHDYFLKRTQFRKKSAFRIFLAVLRNIGGWLLLLSGIAMLVLPGQGLLTIFISMVIIDFPGKRALEIRIISIPYFLKGVNKLRKRAGISPIELPEK